MKTIAESFLFTQIWRERKKLTVCAPNLSPIVETRLISVFAPAVPIIGWSCLRNKISYATHQTGPENLHNTLSMQATVLCSTAQRVYIPGVLYARLTQCAEPVPPLRRSQRILIKFLFIFFPQRSTGSSSYDLSARKREFINPFAPPARSVSPQILAISQRDWW